MQTVRNAMNELSNVVYFGSCGSCFFSFLSLDLIDLLLRREGKGVSK